MNIKKLLPLLLICILPLAGMAQETFDLKIEKTERSDAPANTYSNVGFRLYLPKVEQPLRAVLIFFNDGGFDTNLRLQEPYWATFMQEQRVAIIACSFTNKDDAPSISALETSWYGKLLWDSIRKLADQSKHPEVNTLPLIPFGTTPQGSLMAYNLANWKTSRVAALFMADLPKSQYEVSSSVGKIPSLVVCPAKDLERIKDMLNTARSKGNPWCFICNKHSYKDVEPVGLNFLAATFANMDATNPSNGTATDPAWIGDLKDNSTAAKTDTNKSGKNTVWLPNEAFAKQWQGYLGGVSTSAPAPTPATE
jgi:hypothetical protein